MPTTQLPDTASLRPDFIWGVSTSSFQIEGATQEDGRGSSIWDIYCRAGEIKNHDTGDVACDHYHRYREDIGLMTALGVQAYRFSVAWPRVLPQGDGPINEAGLSFYHRLIDGLLAAGIEPWLCLYHWDLPQALEERGGWLNRESAVWFANYASLIAARFGDRVKRFATFNEPSMFSLFSRSLGKRDSSSEDKLHRMIHNVNLAHGRAVDVLRANVINASIGCIHNRQPCRPSSASKADAAAAARLDVYWNAAFPDPQCRGEYPPSMRAAIEPHMQPGDLTQICRPLDWFGLNHYSPVYVKARADSMLGYDFGDKPPGVPLTPIGWPIEPDAFRQTLLAVHRDYGLPIYVLENGYGDFDQPDGTAAVIDPGRIEFLKAYINAMNEAASSEVDVRGYFVWSLLDNFEWDSGYSIRFGLSHVDYASLRRTPKSSFAWYAGLIKAMQR
ncbi:beta-glucosidase [Bradyrhizobium sp. INPA01-394B]|uniref:Beta-glucosidase n=1 Tax=Bradyrhizobium campsiandrae TaxID=1729892 RepID=A0ABR7U975_9BRAD|nr:GH1 family beta-glucosidase [Bradyrhizobium campsiandrae]MBC9881155.1 beta-glucosidase [Bradyrhizobium campsiandrae]MBC9980009.1 beta-glucosidase [Bradyrhizobium campsiandrae]